MCVCVFMRRKEGWEKEIGAKLSDQQIDSPQHHTSPLKGIGSIEGKKLSLMSCCLFSVVPLQHGFLTWDPGAPQGFHR